MSKKTVTILLLAGLFMSACGVKGELKKPPPLWGDKTGDKQEQKKDGQ